MERARDEKENERVTTVGRKGRERMENGIHGGLCDVIVSAWSGSLLPR